jgi:hypothetical protein
MDLLVEPLDDEEISFRDAIEKHQGETSGENCLHPAQPFIIKTPTTKNIQYRWCSTVSKAFAKSPRLSQNS